MTRYELNGSWYTPVELAEKSGIPAHTIRDRLRRGYPVEEAIKTNPTHDSIKMFSEASYWMDWIGMSINDLHKIYWKWCVSSEYTPLPKQTFSRQLLGLYPMLKTVPTKHLDGYHRFIRIKE